MQDAGRGAVGGHRAAAGARGRAHRAGPRPAGRRRAASSSRSPRAARGRSRPTPCCSPLGAQPRRLPDAHARRRAHPGLDPALRPRRAARAADRRRLGRDRAPSSPAPTTRSAPTSRSCPAATGCCPARTPTPPQVLEEVFRRRGMKVLARSRAQTVKRAGDGVVVTLEDGRTVEGTHCLMAVGSVPNTAGLGLEEAGVTLDAARAHRRSTGSRAHGVPGVYAAGDCTGVLLLASVAAMQGRIAMWHALGDAVAPLNAARRSPPTCSPPRRSRPSARPRTQLDAGASTAGRVKLPLATQRRARRCRASRDGFVKLFACRATGTVIGGVVVGPRASELIFPMTLAVDPAADRGRRRRTRSRSTRRSPARSPRRPGACTRRTSCRTDPARGTDRRAVSPSARRARRRW